jgi:hypothetical protein
MELAALGPNSRLRLPTILKRMAMEKLKFARTDSAAPSYTLKRYKMSVSSLKGVFHEKRASLDGKSGLLVDAGHPATGDGGKRG